MEKALPAQGSLIYYPRRNGRVPSRSATRKMFILYQAKRKARVLARFRYLCDTANHENEGIRMIFLLGKL